MANPALPQGYLAKPDHGRQQRREARQQAKADKSVYALVDARDGLRCRVCREYQGYEIQRHHILARSLGGLTTTANLISLCANDHLVGVHGGHLRLNGNADTNLGVKVERCIGGGSWTFQEYV